MGMVPFFTSSATKTDNTAAAGAQGAETNLFVPPKMGAVSPIAMVPNMPAITAMPL